MNDDVTWNRDMRNPNLLLPPDVMQTVCYCAPCDKTLLFEFKSYPGSGEHHDLKCPHCSAKVGDGQCEIKGLAEADGNIGDKIIERYWRAHPVTN